ncbi:uncharacterized protein N7459_005935 [Penicillium hispanicum]|uniref:uncharacterized protein n=1 Tax=Penicillium hispanicum TaxID=1080232 RepID=UPI00253FA230|nr:uncharacterized protein N7459_005935 [Penicillium hispanicum]KAJ5579950.1 hypothetical protein N7459_005935 [Penicillium hispanicum]
MEAVIFLSSVTCFIALGGVVVLGIAFWKRYRIQLHVTDKVLSTSSRDVENGEVRHALVQPPPVFHGRAEGVQGMQGAQSWTPPVERRAHSMAHQRPMAPLEHPYSLDAGARTPAQMFERSATPGTVSHFVATDARDHQGYPLQKP